MSCTKHNEELDQMRIAVEIAGNTLKQIKNKPDASWSEVQEASKDVSRLKSRYVRAVNKAYPSGS